MKRKTTSPAKQHISFGQLSWRIRSSTVEAFVTKTGGHLAPIVFDCAGRRFHSRHVTVLGIEDITGYFHYGLAPSAHRNRLNRLGEQTCFHLKPTESLNVNYILAVAKVPRAFADTKHIKPSRDDRSVELTSSSGKSVRVPLCVEFVRTGSFQARAA